MHYKYVHVCISRFVRKIESTYVCMYIALLPCSPRTLTYIYVHININTYACIQVSWLLIVWPATTIRLGACKGDKRKGRSSGNSNRFISCIADFCSFSGA